MTMTGRERVLAAMAEVPREEFVPSRLRSLASGHAVACHRAEDALARFGQVRAAEAAEL